MRKLLADLVCCPECRHFPLDLHVVEERSLPDLTGFRLCDQNCAATERTLEHSDPCGACLREDVEAGYFSCRSCARLYFIVDGIPRMLSESYAELIDWSVADRYPAAFEGRERDLEDFRALVTQAHERSAAVSWNLDDVKFWQEVYEDQSETERVFAHVRRSRRDAGNRTFPREQTIFRHLRPVLAGGVLVDVGCGLAQTVRVLCPPSEEDYVYVGVDLSIGPLRTNRDTMPGDFVQCSADQLPFRESAADAVLTLGTLHHVADPAHTMRLAMACLRPGGLIGANEVIYRPRLASRMPGLRQVESPHNDMIALDAVREEVEAHGTVRHIRFWYSPIRGVLGRLLGERMRTRPLLTRVVLSLDRLCLATLGRLLRYFGPREVMLLGQKDKAEKDQSLVATRVSASGEQRYSRESNG